jgi:uncharacterized protein (DUF1501 family)
MEESRRDFLKKSCCALGMTALATQMAHLGTMSALAQKVSDMELAPEGGENYKALVLVFLSGGVDGMNLVIPNHSVGTDFTYDMYAAERAASTLAIPQANLLPITVPEISNLTFGLHPAFGDQTGSGGNAGIHGLWSAGKLAILPNVGSLVRPLTKAQYQSSSFQKPYQLFSHSDQVAQNQTSVSNTQAFTGWGGRISDKMTAGSNPSGLVPMVTSIAGAQLFTSGQQTLPMAIANAGTSLANVLNPAGLSGSANAAKLTAFNELRTIDLNMNYVAAASHVTDLAMQANAALQTSFPDPAGFPNTNIGLQLKQVARLIQRRLDLNINRQIFYCQLGGFDTHNNELTSHNTLLSQLSQALRAFYDEMTAQGMQNNVTTFTLSDFGRTFNPAGSGAAAGTDHAWGNVAFVMGGSVLGGHFYGTNGPNGTPYPTLIKGTSGPNDTDSGTGARGRWIPTTSVDQYAVTLARWYGLSEADVPTVFPNINNFGPAPAFMA